MFDNIYKKLERELQEKKKEMAFIIEVSNIAYEERFLVFALQFCIALSTFLFAFVQPFHAIHVCDNLLIVK